MNNNGEKQEIQVLLDFTLFLVLLLSCLLLSLWCEHRLRIDGVWGRRVDSTPW